MAVYLYCKKDDLKRPPRLTGCGTQHPHRALGGTRVLLAAAPTTPPCFRHWRRSSSLLGIVSGNSILDFGAAEHLRAFRCSFFTGGVVMGNGRCSAAFCESAGLRIFPAIATQNKKAIAFAFLHQRWLRIGAADEARTRYLHLGKVALYQMSYGRIFGAFVPAPLG